MSKPDSTTLEKVVDLVGKEITAGCSVVYPVRRGSSMWLKKMQVQQVMGGKNPELHGYNSEGRRVTIRNLDNCAVIEERLAV
jgi:hypothetical protein